MSNSFFIKECSRIFLPQLSFKNIVAPQKSHCIILNRNFYLHFIKTRNTPQLPLLKTTWILFNFSLLVFIFICENGELEILPDIFFVAFEFKVFI